MRDIDALSGEKWFPDSVDVSEILKGVGAIH